MHIGPENKAMVTLLQFILTEEIRKEEKPQGGKSSLKKGHEKRYQRC